MTAPKYVTECIAAMRAERAPLAARLDAIDLAILNVSRIWGLNGEPSAQTAAVPTPERRKYQRREKPVAVVSAPESNGTEAVARRELLLSLIGKSEMGRTMGELRALTPKMGAKDRTNAIQQLKLKRLIYRVGNCWQKVDAA